MAERLQRVLGNPTLHPDALSREERLPGTIKWHRWAHSQRSSQVFCISAFGTLRNIVVRDKVIDQFVAAALPSYRDGGGRDPRWSILLEHEDRELLSEFGGAQPTSVDALLVSPDAVLAVEAKFVSDAAHGFGPCSKFKDGDCAGYYGPGSDATGSSPAWCQLETWRRGRSPRTYWALGREYFRPEVFQMQSRTESCPFRDSNYQLMRNFLFAAAYARRNDKGLHGVITIAPAATSGLLEEQVARFRSEILLRAHANSIAHTTYEIYGSVLRAAGNRSCVELASFLEERIDTIIGSG